MIAFLRKILCAASLVFSSAAGFLLKAGILFWQKLCSPLFGAHCRFAPSCSQYALEAIDRHGCLLGTYLSIKRVARCNSLCSGGLDPVPVHVKEQEA